MSRSRSVLLLALLLAACQRTPLYQTQLFVFGTTVEITVAGLNADQAARTVGAINERFNEMHRRWHPWRSGLLTDINAAFAQGRSHPITPDLSELVTASRRLEALSGGRFNPAVGRLVAAWGFHTDDFPVRSPVPADEEIAALVDAAPSTRDLHIDGGRIRSDNPAVALDLSGIAKGAAVDWAVEVIRQTDAAGALVSAGGDLRGFGSNDGRPWTVGIRDPADFRLLASLALDGDEAVFTSGNYARFRDEDERRGHVIDPRTGQPAPHPVAATVLADKGVRADAAATALVVAGPERWREIARRMGIEQALIVDADGCIAVTEALHPRLDFVTPPDCIEVVP